MDTNGTTGLLSSVRFSHSFHYDHWIEHPVDYLRVVFDGIFGVIKLDYESIFVLLEDERDETSSKGHDQKVLLLIMSHEANLEYNLRRDVKHTGSFVGFSDNQVVLVRKSHFRRLSSLIKSGTHHE